MRHSGKKLLSGLFAFVMIFTLFSTSASAAVYSSEYLNAYRAIMTPDPGGKLTITVDVIGVGYMPKIGAKTIYLYESTNGTDFTRIKIYRSSAYPKMMGSGTFFYEDVVVYNGTPGNYYYAKVYVYAGDETGYDQKDCDTAIKRAFA